MEIVKRDLGEQFKSIKILALSDMHIGDSLCNLKLIRQVLDEVKNSDNTFIILNGDLINNSIKNSVSTIYDEVLSPMESIVRLTDLLEPVKDRILVIHPGNHEWRSYKEDGIDIVRLVARQLGIEDRFSDGWWYLYLTLGMGSKQRPIMYTLTGVHGYGGGKKKWW